MPNKGKVPFALLAASGCVGIYLFRQLLKAMRTEELRGDNPFRFSVQLHGDDAQPGYHAVVSVSNFEILCLTSYLRPTGQYFVTIDSNCGVRWSRATSYERVGGTSPIPGNSDDESEHSDENGENADEDQSGPANHLIQEFQNGIFQVRSSRVRGHIVTPRRARAHRFPPEIIENHQ